MTLQETGAIMDVLRLAYPKFSRGLSDQDRVSTAKLWSAMFAEDDARIVIAAVKALIAGKPDDWPPSVGAVKEYIRRIVSPEEMTDQEAWGIVCKAMRKSMYGSREAYEELPPILKKLVGSPSQLKEWAVMDSGTVQSVVSSTFQRSYRARAKSEREYAALPDDVKALAQSIGGRLAVTSPEEPRTLHQLREALKDA